jgi:alkylation response protein AidB-like acyl-CoA dehydrogenase
MKYWLQTKLTSSRRILFTLDQKSRYSQIIQKNQPLNMYNPTEEHQSLRQMVRSFVETEVDPQALQHNRSESFNIPLFQKLGSLGLLGVTVDPKYGGSGMDATAAVIIHGNYPND